MYEYQLSNGSWIPASEEATDRMIGRALEFEAGVSPAWLKRPPLTTREQAIALLDAGKELRTGTDWYDNLRAKPAPRPRAKPTLVRCDCGHECELVLVMSASMGSACPGCYDRMSD